MTSEMLLLRTVGLIVLLFTVFGDSANIDRASPNEGSSSQRDCTYEAECQNCTKSPECLCASMSIQHHTFPGVCNAFLQCDLRGTSGDYEYIFTDQMCAMGTVWVQSVVTCVGYSINNTASCQQCSSQTCENGGTCTNDYWHYKGQNISTGFRCHCTPGFGGVKCQRMVPNSCKNGGTSVVTGDYSECLCANGYAGNGCELDCIQQRSCLDCTITPECLCEGYPFNATLASLQHHPYTGVCNAYIQCNRTGNPGNYMVTFAEIKCNSRSVFSSSTRTCNHYIQTAASDLAQCQQCSSMPCKNGGTCRDMVGRLGGTSFSIGFRCVCTSNYKGLQCQSRECSGVIKVPDINICGKYWEITCSGVKTEKYCDVPGILVFDPNIGACNWKTQVTGQLTCNSSIVVCQNLHRCSKYGVKTCNDFEQTAVTANDDNGKNKSCPYYYTTRNSGVSTGNGKAVFRDGAFLEISSLVNIGIIGKLTVEISFAITTSDPDVQALVSNGDCQHETTFSLMLQRFDSNIYTVEGYVMGEYGENFTIVSKVLLNPNTRYTVYFAYDAYKRRATLVINTNVFTKNLNSHFPGKIKNGKGFLFIGKSERCDSLPVRNYFTGNVFWYRILSGEQIPDVP